MYDYTTVSYTVVAECFLSSSVLSLSHDHRCLIQNQRKSLPTHSHLHGKHEHLLGKSWIGECDFPPRKIGMGRGEHKTHIHTAVLLRREIKRKQEDWQSTISPSGTFLLLGSYVVPSFSWNRACD